MTPTEEIAQLNDLKEKGAITQEEYDKMKASILAKQAGTVDAIKQAVGQVSVNDNQWAMFIHLSQYLGYITFLAGFAVPIILWQLKKDQSETIDRHGRMVTNWMISLALYTVISGLLCFVGIGVVLMPILVLLAVIFPIVGALKANDGEVWQYPLTIKFF